MSAFHHDAAQARAAELRRQAKARFVARQVEARQSKRMVVGLSILAFVFLVARALVDEAPRTNSERALQSSAEMPAGEAAGRNPLRLRLDHHQTNGEDHDVNR